MDSHHAWDDLSHDTLDLNVDPNIKFDTNACRFGASSSGVIILDIQEGPILSNPYSASPPESSKTDDQPNHLTSWLLPDVYLQLAHRPPASPRPVQDTKYTSSQPK